MTKLCHNLPNNTHPSHDNIPHHLAIKVAMGLGSEMGGKIMAKKGYQNSGMGGYYNQSITCNSSV